MLSVYEIQHALRLITSPEFKRQGRFPIAVLAQLSGLSRQVIYRARDGYWITDRVTQVLSPLLKAIVSRELVARRGRWHWSVE